MRRLMVFAMGLALVVCGGKLIINQPDGTSAPDGAFVSPDGGLVLASGSGCLGYDPFTFQKTSHEQVGCDNAQSCYQWVADQVPTDFPIIGECNNPGECKYGWQLGTFGCPASLVVHCRQGPDGDAFCAAFYSQFVVGAGKALATCQSAAGLACADEPSDYDGLCVPSMSACAPGANGCDALDLCVTRGDKTQCEQPCMPSP